MTVDLENLKNNLSKNWVRLNFIKLDGTQRSMLCTRNFAETPVSDKPKNLRKINESVLSVFDLEKQSWRSVKIDKILNWSIERTVDE